mgnify:CR=1 FL=1
MTLIWNAQRFFVIVPQGDRVDPDAKHEDAAVQLDHLFKRIAGAAGRRGVAVAYQQPFSRRTQCQPGMGWMAASQASGAVADRFGEDALNARLLVRAQWLWALITAVGVDKGL